MAKKTKVHHIYDTSKSGESKHLFWLFWGALHLEAGASAFDLGEF